MRSIFAGLVITLACLTFSQPTAAQDAGAPSADAVTRDAPADASSQPPAATGSAPTETPAATAAPTLTTSSNDQALVELLLGLLDPDDPAVRSAAAQALSQVNDPRVTGALRYVLQRDVAEVRLAVTQALAAYGGAPVENALYAILRSEHETDALRIAAADSLGALASARAAELLFRTRDTDPAPVARHVQAVLTERYPLEYKRLLAHAPVVTDPVARFWLVGTLALHGGFFMTALADIAGGNPGVLSFLGGAVLGGATPYLLTMEHPPSKARAWWLSSTTTWGLGAGALLAATAGADRKPTLWTAIGGQTVGLAGGLLTANLVPYDAADVAYIDYATIMGIAALGGIASITQPGESTTYGLLVGGMGLGLVGGMTAAYHLDFDEDDATLIAIGTASGAWVGGFTPTLVAGDDVRAHHNGGGALLGAALGGVAGTALAFGTHVTPRDTVKPLLGAGFGSALGGGVALIWNDRLPARAGTGFLLAGGVLGAASGAYFDNGKSATSGETLLLVGAAGWGAWQGFGFASMSNASTDKSVGAALFGIGTGGAVASLASSFVHPTPGQVAWSLAGGVWGGWLSGWSAYVARKHGARLNDDDLMLATLIGSDAGLVLGVAAVSPLLHVPEARLGWINLTGLLGMGLGTSIGAVAGDHISEGNVAGTAIGLVGGAIATAFVDFPKPAADSGSESAKISIFHDVHPGFSFIPDPRTHTLTPIFTIDGKI